MLGTLREALQRVGSRHRDSGQKVSAEKIPRDIWVLIAAAFAVAIGYGLVAPVLPQFAASFGVSVTAATVVISIFAFFRLAFAPAGGVLIDRLGERSVYLSGLGIVILSTLATGLAQSYWQLLVFRGLGGIGSTMFTISAMALIARIAPPRIRGRVSGLYATAFLLGNIGGPGIGGLLAEFGMRLPFFVYAGSLTVALATVAILLAPPRSAKGRDSASPGPPMLVAEAFRQPMFRAAIVSGFANGWVAFGVRIAIIPLFAASLFVDSPAAAGTILVAFAVGNAAIVSLAGRLSDAWGRKPLIITGSVIAATATASLGWCETLPVIVAVSVVAGLGSGMVIPAQQACVADIVGNNRAGGKVMAAFQMSSDCGAIAGPIITGLLVDAAGYRVAFAVSAVVYAAAVIAWLSVRENYSARSVDSV